MKLLPIITASIKRNASNIQHAPAQAIIDPLNNYVLKAPGPEIQEAMERKREILKLAR